MITEFRNEVWKPYSKPKWHEDYEYLVSNYGRVKKKRLHQEEWQLSPTTLVSHYESFGVRLKGKSRSSCYVHRAVAILFLEKKEDEKYVIHLDYDKLNNKASNLKWATKDEMFEHHKNNPKKIARRGKITYSKLTENRVRLIKKLINNPKRKTRMRIIAKQFGVSEMQLYRIKSGENWGHVKELE